MTNYEGIFAKYVSEQLLLLCKICYKSVRNIKNLEDNWTKDVHYSQKKHRCPTAYEKYTSN